MDEILRESVIERYGQVHEAFPLCLVSDILSTQKIAAQSQEQQRLIAHIAFAYLVQLDLHSVSGGFSNKILFTEAYDPNSSWKSPLFRLRDGAIRQYQIVASRIAMEIFMDLLHCIEEGHRLESRRSKLKSFRKWLCDSANQFHYFAHVLLAAYRFDRNLRTPEIHGTPKLPRRLLTLQHPSPEEMNEQHRLLNTLLGCWRPLREMLNGQRPQYMNILEEDMDWFKAYMSGSPEEIEAKLATMFDGLE